jgi:KDO2-lipid IV(A) lauroyltransferase
MDLADRLSTSALLALGEVSRRVSPATRRDLGAVVGRFMMRLGGRRRAITDENIRRALPALTTAERSGVLRGSYENLGIVLTELLATPSLTPATLTERVRIPGFDAVIARKRAGQPTIFLSAHYGNWEYLAMTAGVLLDAPVLIVAHPQSNVHADRLLNSYRTRFGNVIVPMGEAARPLVKTLSAGGTVAFLVDQFGQWEKDPWIPFFGRETPTYEAPAALALKYGAPIFHAFAERCADATYEAPISAIPMDDLRHDKEGIVELTRRHVAILEGQIRKRPELWSWQHRRWRDEYAPPERREGA